MDKTVEQLYDVTVIPCEIGFFGVSLFEGLGPVRVVDFASHFLQDFDFVIGSFEIMRSAFLNFECYVGVILEIFSEPDCGEVAPAEFLDDDISI